MTFYDVVTYGGLLLIGLLLGAYGRRTWRRANTTVDRLLAEHRAAKLDDQGLAIIWPPVKNALPSHRRPPRYREPQRSPDGPTLELAQLANDRANKRLADAHLPHYRQQEQQPK